MFADHARILVAAGAGGDGSVLLSTRGARAARWPRWRGWRPRRRRRPGRRCRHDHPGRLSSVIGTSGPSPAARVRGDEPTAATAPGASCHVPPGTVVRVAADDETDEAGRLLGELMAPGELPGRGARRPRRTRQRALRVAHPSGTHPLREGSAGRGALDRAGAEADRGYRPGGRAERGQVDAAGRADRGPAEGRAHSRSRPPARTWA